MINVIEQKLNIKAKIKFLESQPGDVDITYADSSKAYKLLGYKSLTTIEEGMEKFLTWLNG